MERSERRKQLEDEVKQRTRAQFEDPRDPLLETLLQIIEEMSDEELEFLRLGLRRSAGQQPRASGGAIQTLQPCVARRSGLMGAIDRLVRAIARPLRKQ